MQTDNGYATKMDEITSKALRDWWQGLTKEEILSYLAEQPTVTADTLREMMATTSCVLAFDLRFSTRENIATADFHTNK